LDNAPPGKTCAEAKLDAFLTRWRSKIWFVGEIRRTLGYQRMRGGAWVSSYLELGLGIGGSFMGFFEGWWSAGDDMLRCVAEVPSNEDFMLRVAFDAGSSLAP
jgi:hypothetical protein